MSWLFSRALVAEYLPGNYSDGEQSAQLNVMPTQHPFWRNDKMMDFSKLSQFGLTCVVLTENHGEELLMSYLEGFRARTSAAQEKEEGLREKDQECGSTWQGLLAKYDQDLRMWKTPQCSLLADSEQFSEIWPRLGMMRNGCAYLLPNVARTTLEIGCGYLLPTPTCHNSKEGAYPAEYTRNTPTLATHVGGKINPVFTEWMMGWPLGWTDLQPLAMDRFREWQQQHGGC